MDGGELLDREVILNEELSFVSLLLDEAEVEVGELVALGLLS